MRAVDSNVVDYYDKPDILYDTRLYMWLPYEEGGRGKKEYVDGEYYFARVDGYEGKRWQITYEHDGTSDLVNLATILSSMV